MGGMSNEDREMKKGSRRGAERDRDIQEER